MSVKSLTYLKYNSEPKICILTGMFNNLKSPYLMNNLNISHVSISSICLLYVQRGKLGKGKSVTIPSCVVEKIRKHFLF